MSPLEIAGIAAWLLFAIVLIVLGATGIRKVEAERHHNGRRAAPRPRPPRPAGEIRTSQGRRIEIEAAKSTDQAEAANSHLDHFLDLIRNGRRTADTADAPTNRR